MYRSMSLEAEGEGDCVLAVMIRMVSGRHYLIFVSPCRGSALRTSMVLSLHSA